MTIEGLDEDSRIRALQETFLEFGGAQCGICTPGMILAACSLLHDKPEPTMEDIREALAGNLCRCTGYIQIFEAVAEAARRYLNIVRPESTRRGPIQMRSDPADYDLVAPANLQAALSLLANAPDSWLPIAGGTDLMVQFAAGTLPARKLVSIWGLPELRKIEASQEEIRIGAGCTYSDLRKKRDSAERIPNARESCKLDGRNREPESRHARRQYRECVAGRRFVACLAGV